jgi:hypothetical protein
MHFVVFYLGQDLLFCWVQIQGLQKHLPISWFDMMDWNANALPSAILVQVKPALVQLELLLGLEGDLALP